MQEAQGRLEDGQLLAHARLQTLLYWWSDLSSIEEVRDWVSEAIQAEGKDVIEMLAKLSRPTASMDTHLLAQAQVKGQLPFDLTAVEHFVDLNVLATRLKGLRSEDLSEAERQLVDAFETATHDQPSSGPGAPSPR